MKEEGRCVLFSSHIMQEVAALCDRLIIIVDGQSVFTGSITELQQKYPDERNLGDREKDYQKVRLELLEKNKINDEKTDMWND